MNKLYIYLKRYYGYIIVVLGALVSFLIFYIGAINRRQEEEKEKEKDAKTNFDLGEIKGSLKEKKDTTELELEKIKSNNMTFNRQVDRIKKIKDVNERRKHINNLMQKIPIILIIIILSCCASKKDIEYPSFLPPKIDTEFYLEPSNFDSLHIDDLEGSEIYGKIAFTEATLTTIDGITITLYGGFAIDDYEALKLIQYYHERNQYKQQLELMTKAYNDLYENASKAEKLWQSKLEKDNSVLSDYTCELCFVAGTGTVLGVIYGVDVIIKE